jgi:adenylate kinase family enzyme
VVGERFAIVGAIGSGKTTLANDLANILSLPHIELDTLHWEPGWKQTSLETFRLRVKEAISGESWIVDGTYKEVRDIIWSRSNILVWLDYPISTTFRRYVLRMFSRIRYRKKLLRGTHYSIRGLFNRVRLRAFLFAVFGRRRADYMRTVCEPWCSHLRVIHLFSPEEADGWLRSLENKNI